MTKQQLMRKLKRLDEKYAYPLLGELRKLEGKVSTEDYRYYLKCMIDNAHKLSRACEYWYDELDPNSCFKKDR